MLVSVTLGFVHFAIVGQGKDLSKNTLSDDCKILETQGHRH